MSVHKKLKNHFTYLQNASIIKSLKVVWRWTYEKDLVSGFTWEKRMSQAALADKVSVTPGHIADLETGRRDPGGKLALQIAIVLGFPMEHFYLPAYLQSASKRS